MKVCLLGPSCSIGQTDMKKLRVVFEIFVNAPKNSCWYCKLTEVTIEICFRVSETIRFSCAAETTVLKN